MATAAVFCMGAFGGAFAAPTVGDLKVTAIPPWGLALDYTVAGATADDTAFPLVVTATAGEKSYSARSLVGATNCVNGAHRVYWNMAADGLTATAANSTVTVMYGRQPLYCVIDLAGGMDAATYPVTYLPDVPAGGWTDEYKTTKLVLRRIEAGSFIMGDDPSDTSHRVTLTQPFFMSVFAVTQRQWELVAGTTPSYFTGAMRPVETVSYNDIRGETLGAQWPASDAVDATSFFGRLRAKTGLALDLPTEAQWEYACRAGTTTTYYWGDSMDGAYAWYSGNASRQTHVVGTRLPNAWGLYDMSGNTWEWCRDWYAPLAYGTDPAGPAAPSSGDGRVRRGGCWDADSSYSTSARRGSFDPSERNNWTGDFCFRVAIAERRAQATAQATGVSWSSVADGSGIAETTLTLGLAPTAGAAARALSDGAEVARATSAQTMDVSLSEGRHVLTHDDGETALTATYRFFGGRLVLDRVDVPLWELYPETYGDITHVTLAEGVTEIPDVFFGGCASLVSVTIPTSVTRIGEWAFEGCASLASIAIPTSVTNVGYGAFSGCADALFDVTTIPGARLVDGWVVGWNEGGAANLDLSGARGLANGAFCWCEELVSVKLPAKIASIENEMFAGCSGLTSVTIPAGVTRIGDSAFSDCCGLTSLTIPDSVTSIGSSAFSCCCGLTSVSIPAGVTRIGYNAFSGCAFAGRVELDCDLARLCTPDGETVTRFWELGFYENEEIVLGAGVTAVPDGFFEDCTGVRCVEFRSWSLVKTTTLKGLFPDAYADLTDIVLPEAASFPDGFFGGFCDGCEELVRVNGKDWKALGAQMGKRGLWIEDDWLIAYIGTAPAAVMIPSGVMRVERSAFEGQAALTSVSIPAGVTRIGDYAFRNCGSLTSVTIPAGVTAIGDAAFAGCSGLKSISIPASVASIGDYAFSDCRGLTSVTLPNDLTRIEEGSFVGCRALMSVMIPNGVTDIGRYSFSLCSNLTTVTIPDSVTSIGDHAFYGCSGLTTVTIPAGVTHNINSAFSGCTGMMSFTVAEDNPAYSSANGLLLSKDGRTLIFGVNGNVTIPEGVTRIGDSAFAGRRGLLSVTIPDSVTRIWISAFSGCGGLTAFTVASDNPNYSSANGLLLSKDGRTLIFGVNGNVTIPEGVTRIGYRAFAGRRGLLSVTIPDSVMCIGDYAFNECSGLTSVTIPSSVTSIGYGAFSGCSGMMWFTVAAGNPTYSSANGLLLSKDGRTLLSSVNGNVTIPAGVTAIGDSAFAGRSEPVSVTIPKGVTSIGDSAFSGCGGLLSVTIPDSVTSIGASAFKGCADALFDATTIPGVRLVDGWVVGWDEGVAADLDLSGVRGLADGAFSGCEELVSVKLPAGMTGIGSSAFKDCSGLTSLAIPSSVTSIGDSAFEGCSGLTSVTIPSSVTEIGHAAFSGCDSVGRVELDCDLTCLFTPDGEAVECLGDLGFCESVEEVVLSATDVPDGFFEGFTGVRRVEFREGCPVVWWTKLKDLFPDAYAELTDVVLPEDAFLPDGFFDGCGALMPSDRMDWRAIGERMGKQGLWVENGWALAYIGTAPAEVAIPDGVTGIGCSAFAGQTALAEVSIPSSVTCIGTSAFFGCGGLASVSISARVTEIGGGAFSGCGSLTSLVVAADNPNYMSTNGNLLTKDGRTLLRGVKGANGRGTIPAGVTEIGDEAFAGYGGLTAVAIPAGVTRIGMGAFRECMALQSVTIPAGVTEIGAIAFCDCCSLKSVTIPSSVTRIGFGAFLACSSLQSVTIPSGVTEIGEGTFCDCNSLQSVTIPASVTRIGRGAFVWCGELASFAVAAGNPNYTSVNGLLLSKDGRTLLRGVKGRVTIPSGVTEIGDEAFNGLRGLMSVTIPTSVTRIGKSAFFDCPSLKAVAIPSGVTEIGDSAFRDCSGLQSVTIPSGVTRIENEAFKGCASLKAVAILSGVTEIGEGTFCECSSLTSVTIPKSVTGIGWGAFSRCSGLTSVTIPASVTCIADEAFFNCRSLKSVTVPASVTWIGDGAFGWCCALTSFAVAADNPNYTSANGLLLTKDGQTLLQGVNGRVTIPAGVTEIRGSAFAGLSGLTSFAVAADNPNYTSANGLLLTKDGQTLVEGVNGRVAIPAGVTAIDGCAFEGRRGLTSVTIPESVTEIGWGAFSRCSGLTSVTIPAGVTEIGWGAFQCCSSLTSFTVAADNPSYRSANGLLLTKDGRTLLAGVNGRVTIPSGVTEIGDGAFAECSGLTSVTIPSGVTEIGDEAFQRCSSLTAVTIPESVTRIGQCSFGECRRLQSVTIPGRVTEIGEDAFADCGLTSMTISAGVTAIDIAAFGDCEGLRTLKIPTGLAVSNRRGVSLDGGDVYTLDAFRGVTVIVDGSEDPGEEPDASYGPFVPGAQVSIDLPDLVGYAAKGLPSGLKFDSKTGRITGAATKGGVTATVTFTKRGAPTYTARLVVGPFPRLTVEVNDAAGGRVAGAGAYAAGKKVSLRATAAKGCVFAGWYLDADFETPLAGDVDYRTPTLPYVIGTSDASLYAKFVAAEDDAAALVVPPVADEYAPNAAIEPIVLDVSGCVSLPKVTAKGLPPGLKFTTKALDVKATKTAPAAHYAANTVYGTPTKSGVYAATFAVTTAGKMTAAESVTFVVVDRVKGERVLKVVADAARGRAAGVGVYAAGRKAALKATAAKGFVFAGWYADAAFTTPLAGDVDWRTPSLPYVTGDGDETVYARFVPASEDGEIGLCVDGQWATDDAADAVFETSGELSLALEVASASLPKVALAGLPAGLKFTAKAVFDRAGNVLAEANTVYGTATKPGTYAVTAKIANATVKRAVERRFTIVVDNLTGANGLLLVTDAEGGEAGLRNGRGEKYAVCAGVAELDLPSIVASDATGKVTLSGLPAGLRYDAKTGKVTGVATKAGTYTVTATVRSGRDAFVSTFTVEVAPLPAWAAGTFGGEVDRPNVDAEDESDEWRKYGTATLTVSSAGKMTAKILAGGKTWSFSADGFAAHDAARDAYRFRMETRAGDVLEGEILRDYHDVAALMGEWQWDGGIDPEGTFAPAGREPYHLIIWRNENGRDGRLDADATGRARKALDAVKAAGRFALADVDPKWGTVAITVDARGNVKAAGTTADGVKVSASGGFLALDDADPYMCASLVFYDRKTGLVYDCSPSWQPLFDAEGNLAGSAEDWVVPIHCDPYPFE